MKVRVIEGWAYVCKPAAWAAPHKRSLRALPTSKLDFCYSHVCFALINQFTQKNKICVTFATGTYCSGSGGFCVTKTLTSTGGFETSCQMAWWSVLRVELQRAVGASSAHSPPPQA